MGCDCGDVDCDEIEVGSGGIGPDSVFYFLDRFGNGLDNKEERVAEIKAMVEKGDFDAAHRVLEIYLESAEALSEESDPELRDEARRSAIAIRNTLDELRESIPEGERERFYDEIIETERDFLTAVEISSRIRDLCVQLAELDPMEYSRMCQVGEDAPRWQRRLHRDLTADQKETAKEFVKIMKQCFKTSGQDCACEEIPFYDFSIACSRAAPLAIACDIDGEEIACDDLENLEMPELPDWLEPIWEDLEEEMMKAQYDMHMPRECVEAGVTSPRECGRVMIETHAPLECKSALLSSGCEDERECREICDAIMFELHTPQECIDGGITDPEECARFMDSFRGPGGGLRGPDCGRIEDPMERLECYDNRGNEFEDHYGPGEGYEGEGELTWQCRENRIHWPPDCETFMREEWPEQDLLGRSMWE